MSILRLENMSFSYVPGKPILDNVSLEITADREAGGHVTAIMGSSGSGKSTLLRLVSGLETPNRGRLFTDPVDPVISYVQQDSVFFEHLSRVENARYFEKIRAYRGKFDSKLFDELAETLGLQEILNEKTSIDTMSGGERQRVSLLRALSIHPDLLLMDEPCTGLDTHVKLDFLQKLRQIVSRYSLLVLYVTHHPDEAMLIADEVVYLLKQPEDGAGLQILRGAITEFAERPAALEVARLFNNHPLNVLTCAQVSDAILNVAGVDATQTNGEPRNVYLAFSPQTAHLTEEAGFAVIPVGTTPIYTYVQMRRGGAILVLQTMRDRGRQKELRVKLEGPALLYTAQGKGVKAVHVTSEDEGMLCLKNSDLS